MERVRERVERVRKSGESEREERVRVNEREEKERWRCGR